MSNPHPQNQHQDEADDEHESGGGASAEVIKSYFAFALRAVRNRGFLTSGTLFVGIVLTALAVTYYPRTFVCTTVLMGQGSAILEGSNATAQAFPGAASLITRKENLEAIIRQTGLARTFYERRPPLLQLKDRLRGKVVDEKTMISMLVGTLQSRILVTSDWSTLTVNVGWTDGKTAAEIAEAARESYVKTRHAAELSAFEEKTSILEGHSARVRQEIEKLAAQISAGNQKEVDAAQRRSTESAAESAAAVKPAPVARVEMRRKAVPNERMQQLQQQLAAKKQRLAEFDAERERRVREERAKIADLKLRLMPSHPEVVTAEQRLAIAAQVSSETLLLRSEIQSLEAEATQVESLESSGTLVQVRPSSRSAAAPASAEPLPNEIIGLLKQNDADPILVAQLSGAITTYGSLRDGIRGGRIELDTAQAAFNQRYKLIVPAEAPLKPSKPNVLLLLGGGLALSLLLALLIPILLELRTGIIVESWQVHHVRLPVLAELRLPTRSSE